MSNPDGDTSVAGPSVGSVSAASMRAAVLAKNLATYRKRRGTITAACTRIEKYVDSLRAVDINARTQLEERRTRLDIYWKEFNELQAAIEDIDETEVPEREQFENAFYVLTAKIANTIRSAAEPGSARSSPSELTMSVNGAYGIGAVAGLRLPKLNLPTFSGRYEEWFPFHDTFRTLIHENATLPKIQWFQYLQSALTGEAKTVIESLEVSERNYDVAWDMLRERYDNKRVIVYTHIRSMIELPNMQRENAAELQRMCDGVNRHFRALVAMQRSADQWDDLLIYMLSSKLDSVTSREWHASLSGAELPTMKQFTDFLMQRVRVLESVSRRNASTGGRGDVRPRTGQDVRRRALHVTANGISCEYCRGAHSIYACPTLVAMPVSQRIAEIRRRKLCLNCLRSSSHRTAQCPSGNCRMCHRKHHSMLHLNREQTGNSGANEATASGIGNRASDSSEATVLTTREAVGGASSEVFLSTALIYIIDGNQVRRPARALLDSGSQANFMTTKLADALKLKSRPVDITISDVGQLTTRSTRAAWIEIQSRTEAFAERMECVITERITDKIPAVTVARGKIEVPAGVRLADPQFYRAADVDILIGAELFYRLICVGQIGATQRHPTLQKTRLGWVLSGRIAGAPGVVARAGALHASITSRELDERVKRFWEMEEPASSSCVTADEQMCERFFNETVETNAMGRYIVRLPVKTEMTGSLGESREIALKRFATLEKRLAREARFRDLYTEFMRDYARLGHMRAVPARDLDRPGAIYLPHHGILKGDETNAKLRVVFDASCRTSTGVALNDALMKGPTIQQDLVSILLRFRLFTHVFAADIVKMYRQILVHDDDIHRQRIVWREDPGSHVTTFELRTVTYGTKSAPFLATACLRHLAQKHADKYPVGSERILSSFYVDDVLTGADTVAEAKQARDEIISILKLGQFQLDKWVSNCEALIPGRVERGDRAVTFDREQTTKVLGVWWDPVADKFRFAGGGGFNRESITKRVVLAEIAGLIDPMGFLGPMTVVAKMLLQEMWQLKLEWDKSLPQEIHQRWMEFKEQLTCLAEIRIPRGVKEAGTREIELHGFCDASERAYGACVYVRTGGQSGRPRVALLASKSRVAPVKAVSLPRLELSAAKLLAELTQKICIALERQNCKKFLWTDSMVALHWIASSSRRWNAFVANRVGEIQRLTEIASWRHVPSAENPADILSRGRELKNLARESLWWTGPEFLRLPAER
ncbi:uncharacterized protein [Cardiocondyla obscurior]|uniref:uncharacterized protein n=1 Tax=Cardiocondyla obscurior TaxID=286306 RepID=UPI003965710B